MPISRRSVLFYGGLGALGAASVGIPFTTVGAKDASELPESRMPRPFQAPFTVPPILQPVRTGVDADGRRQEMYVVTERLGSAAVVPGLSTPVFGYNGIVPGPRINTDRDTHVVLRVRNQLPAVHPQFGTPTATAMHLHGSVSLPQFDGYANDLSEPGFRKDYHFTNPQPAATLWYHDHQVHFTGQNVYSGLNGMYQLHDEAERALLPQGEFDIPLSVKDIMLDSDGSLIFDDHSQSGLWGDIIVVNAQPWPVMQVKRRIYRFRLLNTSIARSFRPALSTGDPLILVATDDGLMPRPQPVASYRHANSERYEFLIDFSQYQAGTRVELRNLSNKNNIDFDFTDRIMAFDVTDAPFDTRANRIPETLVTHPALELQPAQAVRTRHLRFERQGGEWTINRETWEEVIASNFQHAIANPGLNDVEIWELENKSGGWFHPIHLHLVNFKILDRNGSAPFPYENGPKDVVYLGENETVRLITRFGPFQGRYMLHCHNVPHEDHAMMSQFRIGLQEGEPDPNDPIHAAPPVFEGLEG
jgi:spore coat protein A, manganese oxidase